MSFYDSVHESFDHNGYVIQICQDDGQADNPIGDDEAIHVAMWHPNYDWNTGERFEEPQDFEDYCKANGVTRLPLYMFEHSGITVSTADFGDRWDSGQVGWVYLTAQAIKEHGIPNPEDQLRGAVKQLDDWLTGNVWGFRILRKCRCCGKPTEEVDACWGFYGDPEGEECYVRNAALEACPNPSPVLAI
jgi:hypothetical protein